MCGILTLINKRGFDEKKYFENLLDLMRSRGPDEKNIFFNESKTVWMGHTRLRINDLSSKSIQPMKRGCLVLSFNGEVYNFRELILRHNLSQKLSTSGDTEVLIRLIEKCGIIESLREIEGMFSISVYDSQKNKIYFATDRRGEKPLYLNDNDKDNIVVSSQINTIKALIDHTDLDQFSLEQYLSFGYISGPSTIYKNIKKFLPGRIMEISITNWERKIYEYEPETNFTYSYTKDNKVFKELIINSVSDQLKCDAPKGLFLSSGIDSSLIASIAKKELGYNIPTYTAFLKDNLWDESQKAEEIANFLDLPLNKVLINSKVIKNYFQKYDLIFDEPFSDPSQVACFEIAKQASKNVKVLLGGDGADELFFGYRRYKYSDFIRKIKQFKVSSFLFFLIKNSSFLKRIITSNDIHGDYRIDKLIKILNSDHNNLYRLLAASEPNSKKYLKSSISNYLNSKNGFRDTYTSDIRLNDLLYYLPWNNLVKLDRTSMANSIEARSPFLNSKIYNFAVNQSAKFHGNKRILRNLLKEYLPKEIIDKPKVGFGMPVSKWVNLDLKEEVKYYLSKEKIEEMGFFEGNIIDELITSSLQGNNISSLQVWRLMLFSKWFESNI